jgi:hypothetical protein
MNDDLPTELRSGTDLTIDRHDHARWRLMFQVTGAFAEFERGTPVF